MGALGQGQATLAQLEAEMRKRQKKTDRQMAVIFWTGMSIIAVIFAAITIAGVLDAIR